MGERIVGSFSAEVVDRITEEEARFLFAVPIDMEVMHSVMNAVAQAHGYLASTSGGLSVWSGPTSACWDCGTLIAPQNLWVGKKSGVGLCDGCMGRWEKAGRAKRSGDF